MSRWYILDENNKPILTESMDEYLEWEGKNSRTVARDIIGDVIVSTVFLGLDHSWDGGIPVLWETMVFNGSHDGFQDRYISYEDAMEGHQQTLELLY